MGRGLGRYPVSYWEAIRYAVAGEEPASLRLFAVDSEADVFVGERLAREWVPRFGSVTVMRSRRLVVEYAISLSPLLASMGFCAIVAGRGGVRAACVSPIDEDWGRGFACSPIDGSPIEVDVYRPSSEWRWRLRAVARFGGFVAELFQASMHPLHRDDLDRGDAIELSSAVIGFLRERCAVVSREPLLVCVANPGFLDRARELVEGVAVPDPDLDLGLEGELALCRSGWIARFVIEGPRGVAVIRVLRSRRLAQVVATIDVAGEDSLALATGAEEPMDSGALRAMLALGSAAAGIVGYAHRA